MGDDFEAFIEAQKAQLAQERRQLENEQIPENAKQKWIVDPHRTVQVNGRNVMKENLPPKPGTPVDVGLVAKLGSYSEKRQRLQQERKQEYNQLLAEKNLKHRGKPAVDVAPPGGHFPVQGRDRTPPRHLRDAEHGAEWMLEDGRPPPRPRRGWATPTYEQILERKRQEEKNYRRMEDPIDPGRNFGNPDYGRISLSEGNLHQKLNEEMDRFKELEQEFERKKVRFVDGRRPTSNPDDEAFREVPPHNDSRTNGFHLDYYPGKDSQRRDMPQGLRKTGSEPENFHGTLLIGQEMKASQDKRKRAAYGQELQRQMEEAKARKQREKMELRQGVEVDRTPHREPNPLSNVAHDYPPPSPPLYPPPPQHGFPPSAFPQSNIYNIQTMRNADIGQRQGLYEDRLRPQPYTAFGNILTNGLGLNSNLPPQLMETNPSLVPPMNPYGTAGISPLNDAYNYYGMQNLLDPRMAPGVPSVPQIIPPAQTSAYSSHLYKSPVQSELYHQVAAMSPLVGARSPSMPQMSGPVPGLGFPSTINQERPEGGRVNLPGDDFHLRKQAQEEKKKIYQMELQRQMEEDKLKKQRQKEEQERYDKKLEAEISNYSPFGQPGGGAPMRDKFGNIITTNGALRKPDKASQSPPNSYVAEQQRAPPVGSFEPFTDLGIYRSDLPDQGNGPGSGPSVLTQVGTTRDGETRFARGGNGIFGEPMTNEEKNKRQEYQDDLRQQIEESKKRKQEEKERLQREEELMMKKIKEDNLKRQKEEEEERRKKREQEEEAERRRLELRQQQEEQKQEAERKRKEAQEAKEEERRRQEEEKRRAAETERVKSPPVPAAATRTSMRRESARSPPVNGTASPMAPTAEGAPPASHRREERQNPTPVYVDQRKSEMARMESARALDHLAKMRQKLKSERIRVESDLKKEQMAPQVVDRPHPVIGRPPRQMTNDGVFVRPATRSGSNLKKRTTSHDREDDLPLADDDVHKKAGDGFHGDQILDKPRVKDGLEDWQQRARLFRRGSNEIRTNRNQKSDGFLKNKTHGGSSRPSSNLQAETNFLAIPENGAEEVDQFPDDLEDMKKQKSALNQRQRKVTISVKDEVNDPVVRTGSVASLDPEELKRKNREREKKLKSYAEDNISADDPDEFLKSFVAKQNHSRPPSSNTLIDDSWMKPGTSH